MAECSEIEAGGEVRTIKDATARNGVATNTAAIEGIIAKIPSNASSSNKMATQSDVTGAKPLYKSGTTQDGVKWQRFGRVVTVQFDGTFTDGQTLTLPFAPAINTATQLWWVREIRGYADLLTTKQIKIHTSTTQQMIGMATYITPDNVQ